MGPLNLQTYFYSALTDTLSGTLSQNQLDALFDLFYNIGVGSFNNKSPKLQNALKIRNIESILKEMNHGEGDSNAPGLKKRRDWERQLFMTPIIKPHNISDKPLPYIPNKFHKPKVQSSQISENKSNIIRLNEADLRYIVSETTKRVFEDYTYSGFNPISYNTEITLHNGAKTKSYVSISNGITTYHIASDDGCYVVYHEVEGKIDIEPCNHWEPCIIRELKRLPNFPE